MNWGSVKNSEGPCVFCTVPIRGAKPPLYVQYKIHKPPQSFWQLQFQSKNHSSFLFFVLEFQLELELGLKLEWLEGVSKTLGGLMYFVPYLYGGRSPPYNYNTKYTSLPRVFDTPSSHSNFNSNSNSNSNSNPNLNSKFTTFNEIYPTCHLPYLCLKSNL